MWIWVALSAVVIIAVAWAIVAVSKKQEDDLGKYIYRRAYKGAKFTVTSDFALNEEDFQEYFAVLCGWYDGDMIADGFTADVDYIDDLMMTEISGTEEDTDGITYNTKEEEGPSDLEIAQAAFAQKLHERAARDEAAVEEIQGWQQSTATISTDDPVARVYPASLVVEQVVEKHNSYTQEEAAAGAARAAREADEEDRRSRRSEPVFVPDMTPVRETKREEETHHYTPSYSSHHSSHDSGSSSHSSHSSDSHSSSSYDSGSSSSSDSGSSSSDSGGGGGSSD